MHKPNGAPGPQPACCHRRWNASSKRTTHPKAMRTTCKSHAPRPIDAHRQRTQSVSGRFGSSAPCICRLAVHPPRSDHLERSSLGSRLPSPIKWGEGDKMLFGLKVPLSPLKASWSNPPPSPSTPDTSSVLQETMFPSSLVRGLSTLSEGNSPKGPVQESVKSPLIRERLESLLMYLFYSWSVKLFLIPPSSQDVGLVF